ncbi:MAG: tryptophan 7-halogenase [Verrucomicrobiota bacterium]
MSRPHFQITVIGSGFAGSLLAMIAQRLGFSTLLIERGKHPRFAIGESSTPLANLLLEEIAVDFDLPFLRPLCKWGSWQKELPQLGCGLKRGFTFYHHQFDEPFQPDPRRERQLLVGASPNETVADTHWYRPDFDHYFVQQADSLGVTCWDETELERVIEEAGGMKWTGKRRGEAVEITSEFFVDATGPRGCLFQKLGLSESRLRPRLATQALFSHFRDVGPLPKSFAINDTPPYPPEQAAVHHVFDGGWVWVLKFNNGITSAGVAAKDDLANNLGFNSRADAWHRFLKRLPSLAEIFEPAQAVVPFVYLPRIAFQSSEIIGERWALLPSAAGFVDPLLSTGFPLTLLGVKRIAEILRSHWRRTSFGNELQEYAQQTTAELDATTTLVEAMYATMNRFEVFRSLALLYFAAASFSESARRLGKSHLADSFLLCRNPVFAKQLNELCLMAKQARSTDTIAEVERRIFAAIEPFDVMGVTNRSRHHWHPAAVSDLFLNRAKLGATEPEITTMLQKCGLSSV